MFLSFFKYTVLIYVTLSLGGWIEFGSQNLSSHVAKFNASFGVKDGAAGFAQWFQGEWKEATHSIKDSMERNVAASRKEADKVEENQEDIGQTDKAKLKGLILGIEKGHNRPNVNK